MLKHAETPVERLSFETDAGEGPRARLGLLVLESDQTMESEFRQWVDKAQIAVYHARLANDATVSSDTLAQMENELPVASALLPDYLGLDAIGYGCTSGSTIIGEDKVAAIIARAHPGVPSTNPLTASKAALRAMGVKRIALLTPYTPEVTRAMEARFEESGIEVALVGSFYEESDIVVGKISPNSILKAAIEVGEKCDCDGVFISCTSLRAASIIEQAEAALGKPVTASNHAMAWHMLRLAGIDDSLEGHGRLFQTQLAQA